MDDSDQIAALKRILLHEVSHFCRNDNSRWKRPIVSTLSEIRKKQWPAVLFGGTLRSLLVSRLKNNTPGKPRDIDIVTKGASLSELRTSFEPYISRETRFGGLQLRRVDWQFDMWPLEQTYALKEDSISSPEFEDLPNTTFLNIEAIAVDVWPAKRRRMIFSGNEQFFRGFLTETIEINRSANPFPELCVVRSIVMAANLGWRIGPQLSEYIADYGNTMSSVDFDEIQRKHYGRIQWHATLFHKAIDAITEESRNHSPKATALPLPLQLTFWPECGKILERINLRILRIERSRRNFKTPLVD